MHVGMKTQEVHGGDDLPLGGPTSDDMMRISGRALVAGQYHKGKPYSIEATMMFAVLKLCRQDKDMDAWVLMGVVTRLATKMGYHRDPRLLKGITPFEGEMRRRTFFAVEAMDLLLSFQAGMPPILNEKYIDADAPRNLFDSDFDEDCEELPPGRPMTEPTPMLYCYYKRQQIKFLRSVACHALAFVPPPYEETMMHDEELHKMHEALPACVRIQPLSLSFIESTQTITIRLNIELLYLRSVCVLHRRYLSYEKSDPRYNYSRKACVDSALQALKYEAELYYACQPGGRFYREKWVASSLILYDFLLAAMLICLDLYESRHKVATASREELEMQAKKYDALRQSHVIWTSRKGEFRDAAHASNVLEVMLSKVPDPRAPSILPLPPTLSSGTYNSVDCCEKLENKISPYAAGLLDNTPQTSSNGTSIVDPCSTDPLDTIFSESDPIDWVGAQYTYIIYLLLCII